MRSQDAPLLERGRGLVRSEGGCSAINEERLARANEECFGVMIEHNLSDQINNIPGKYHVLRCGCASCRGRPAQAKSGTSSQSSSRAEASSNLDYRELVWDYQGLQDNIGSRNTVEFSLYRGPSEFSTAYDHRGNELGVTQHSDEQVQFITSVFDRLDDLIDIDFKQVESEQTGDIRIFRTYSNSNWGERFNNPDSVGGGTMYGQSSGIDVEWRDMDASDAFNEYEKSTIVHEIGHALGLDHPGGDGDNANWDEWDSIMSYNDREGLDEEPTWFSDLDIQALQSIWGTEHETITFNVNSISWSATLIINREIVGSGEQLLQAQQVGKDEFGAGPKGSRISGGIGNEVIRGLAGWDILDGGSGDDFIRGGNGRDIITGGQGSDELHGDFGWNTYTDQRDRSIDLIAIKSDQLLSNHWYGKAGNNAGGQKSDIIEGLDPYDQIMIIGASDDQLSFRENISHKGLQGIGIYADGALEAIYSNNDLTLDQIKQMTMGDGSQLAMSNQIDSYWVHSS